MQAHVSDEYDFICMYGIIRGYTLSRVYILKMISNIYSIVSYKYKFFLSIRPHPSISDRHVLTLIGVTTVF